MKAVCIHVRRYSCFTDTCLWRDRTRCRIPSTEGPTSRSTRAPTRSPRSTGSVGPAAPRPGKPTKHAQPGLRRRCRVVCPHVTSPFSRTALARLAFVLTSPGSTRSEPYFFFILFLVPLKSLEISASRSPSPDCKRNEVLFPLLHIPALSSSWHTPRILGDRQSLAFHNLPCKPSVHCDH